MSGSRIARERDYIGTLANVHTCYGHRGNRERLRLAMLTAYFDESGIHAGDHPCIVAGWVGNEAQWSAFIADWIPAIKPRQNLHMNDLPWGRRPDRVRKQLAEYGPIPYRYNLSPVYCGMWHRDYEQFMKGKVREKFTTPWMNCAQTCMAIVLTEIAGDDEVLFLFDRQDLYGPSMNALSELVFQFIGVDSRIKDVQFINRKSTVCLDPADYLAFQVREFNATPNSAKAKMGMPILAGKPRGGIFTREQVAERTDEWIRAGMVPGGKPVQPTRQLLSDLIANPYWRGPKNVGMETL